MADALDQYDPLFQAAGQEWNVDWRALKAIAAQESRGDPRAVSKAGAQGLMQIMPDTARKLGMTDPFDPAQSIYGGAKYMSQAIDAEHDSPAAALLYYHGGPGWRQNYGRESAAYVPAVAGHYQQYAKVETKTATDAMPTKAVDDPFSKALQEPAQATQPAAAEPAQGNVPDAFTQALGGGSKTSNAPPPTTMQQIGAGLVRAAHDITDRPAELLARGAAAIGLPGPTPEQTVAADAAERAAYEQQYGNSRIATAARIGGQIAGTIPIVAGAGNLLGAAGGLAGATVGRVAPMAGRAIDAGNALLGGTLTASTPAANLLARGASLASQGALGGAAAGALLSGQSDDPLALQVARGAAAGAVAGPVAGAIGAGVNELAGKAGGALTEIATLAKLAREKYGIPITAPQLTRNPLIRAANEQSASLPFSGAGPAMAAQQTAWQRAVSRTFGEDAPLVTPEVMQRAARRIGGQFDDIAQRTTIQADQPLLTDLGRIQAEARQTLTRGEADAIDAQLENVMGAAAKGNGVISGEQYQALTRANAPLGRAQQSADPNTRFYARQIRTALDDAFERSASSADRSALQQARYQYRNMKTIEDLVEKSPDGNLSPALLMGQVRSASSKFDSSTGGMAYTGGGELGDLARIGQLFLKPSPNSTTADRLLVNSLLGGGAVSAAIANPWTAVSIPIGLAANRAAGNYLRSGWLADRLIESSINPPAISSQLGPYVSPVAVIGANALIPPTGR